MRALPIVFWILAFLAATFCWMVIFQHGLSLQAFTSGAREECACCSRWRQERGSNCLVCFLPQPQPHPTPAVTEADITDPKLFLNL